MKVVFLVNSPNGPSTRYRVLQYFPYFKKMGMKVMYFTIPKSFKERINLFFNLNKYNIVFLQKRLLSAISSYILRLNSKLLFFDFDDSIMFRDSKQDNFYSSIRRRRFRRIVRMSDMIIAGNKYLKDHAEKYNNHVIIIPTPIDMERYKPKIYRKNQINITLGWIGSSSTLFYLKKLRDVLDNLYEENQNVRLKIVADQFFNCKKIPVNKKIWRYEDEIEDLHSFDIGLMPLTDDLWTRGKCGFKLLQYMAVGLPVICSPVGVNKEIVQHGVNGFWAKDEKDWFEIILKLMDNLNLRKEIGEKAIETVKERYSLEIWAPQLFKILNSIKTNKKLIIECNRN